MKIAICGSMAFSKEMLKTKEQLINLGHEVIIPEGTELYITGERQSESKWEKLKLDPIKKYFEEIQKTDSILILNYMKNNINNYIGGNSFLELAFAHVLDKGKFLLNDIPQKNSAMNYTDEIIAMKPIALKGDITKIGDHE